MPGPFTAVLKCRDCVPACVTAGLDSVGIRMPGAVHARELIRRSGKFIAAPSANLSGKPSPTRVQHVIDDFAGKVPVILNGGEAAVGLESTVCDLTGDIALVVGGENSGVAALTKKKCDKVLSLPLKGKVNSLNASVALGIAAYEAVRQRK